MIYMLLYHFNVQLIKYNLFANKSSGAAGFLSTIITRGFET